MKENKLKQLFTLLDIVEELRAENNELKKHNRQLMDENRSLKADNKMLTAQNGFLEFRLRLPVVIEANKKVGVHYE